MNLNKLYEKINGLVALEIFDYGDTQKTLEKEFSGEFLHLNNLTPSIFKDFDMYTQFSILRIYDVYFRNGKPLISDSLYDGLYKIYEAHNGVDTNPVMFEPSINAWSKAKHDIPMGSLDKQTSIEDIEKWNLKTGIAGKGILISEKLDGISLELNYSKGKFVRAVTRGDGVEGDDITENAIYFNGVVKELQEPWDCAVRGEVMIVKDNLEKINKILVSNGKEPLKNTRNGVAGQATKFKERNEEILSLITFLAYELQVFQIHETGENVL